MTDELKFYDPETGKPMHRVPEGATIPAGTPCGYIDSLDRRWCTEGSAVDVVQRDYPLRFTREPIAPPAPPLPTEPGFYLDRYAIGSSKHISFVPMTLVPTETWDRLRVLDPEDTRDRVDAYGGVWRYRKKYARWESENGDCFYYLESTDNNFGPLRFADEVSGDDPQH